MISTITITHEDGTLINRREVAGIVELITTLQEFESLGFRRYFVAPVGIGYLRSTVTVNIQHWEI